MEKNIQGVIDNGLCSACGSCAGICPVNAIQMEANPAGFLYASINKEKCIGCAKCLRICPSFYENIPYIVPEDWSDGKYLTGYVGYAVSEEIREESQSGGLVSALLTYMLKNGTIDGAVVSDFDISLQKPIPKYVSSEEDIVHAAGSYYSQVPMLNMLWNHQDEKVAVVALGCQSESIHLAVDRLKMKRPEMILGLVCGWQFSMEMTNDLIRLGGLKEGNLKHFWPRKKKRKGGPGEFSLLIQIIMNTGFRGQKEQVSDIIIGTIDVFNALTIIMCMQILRLVIHGSCLINGGMRN